MLAITANDLKRNGIVGIERAMIDSDEHQVFVDVRGKAKYIIFICVPILSLQSQVITYKFQPF